MQLFQGEVNSLSPLAARFARVVLAIGLGVSIVWQSTPVCAEETITPAAAPLLGESLIRLPKVDASPDVATLVNWQEPLSVPYAGVASGLSTTFPGQQVVSLAATPLLALNQAPFEDVSGGDPNAPPAPLPSDGPLAAPTPPAEEPSSDSSDVKDKAGELQTLGKEPPKSIDNLEFLRRQTVLLKTGQWQADVGLTYTMFENTFPIAVLDNANQVIGVVQGRSRQRLATIPFELRYGLTDRIQAFCALPVGWANSEISFPGSETHDDIGGLADLRTGASFLVRHGCGWDPDLVATLTMTAPTGDPGPFSIGLAPGARLGEGYWGVAANLLWVHTLDPIILFYGVGYKHRFDAELSGLQVNPGEEFNLQMGVGFALNPNVTLSSSFLGVYISQYEANNVQLAGSELEIARQRFSVTIARGNRIVEPFAEIGMTQDSPGYRCGVVWTF